MVVGHALECSRNRLPGCRPPSAGGGASRSFRRLQPCGSRSSVPSNKPMKQTTSPQGHRVESNDRLGGAVAAYRQSVRRSGDARIDQPLLCPVRRIRCVVCPDTEASSLSRLGPERLANGRSSSGRSVRLSGQDDREQITLSSFPSKIRMNSKERRETVARLVEHRQAAERRAMDGKVSFGPVKNAERDGFSISSDCGVIRQAGNLLQPWFWRRRTAPGLSSAKRWSQRRNRSARDAETMFASIRRATKR